MAAVVFNYAVGNVETFLAGADERKETLEKYCSSYRVFRHTDSNRICVVAENVDLERMKAALSSPQAAENRAKNTILPPMDRYIEVEGAA